MKILKSWLKDFIDFDLSDQELEDKLTFSGTLVEDVFTGIDRNVIVVKILDIKKHPNADKLRIVKISDGKTEQEIVCGANNIEKGQIVPFAQIGAKFGDFEIKKINIRGVDSSGMLCSPKELGLSEDHSGILILDKDYELGKPLAEYLDQDSVFDLEITPNRGDCLSHLGIARELGAVIRKRYRREPIAIQSSADQTSNKISVEVSSKELCPKYFARYIKNVKIGPSPDWLQKRLLKFGINPINNIVDITNYIMLDLGQPLHAFDADKIKGNKIVVRKAKPEETITTLDREVRQLTKDILVIADQTDPIAIAGIMGSSNSEISGETKNVVLEAAIFDRKSIRKTAKNLGLTTEASYRFERGVDHGGGEYAINKAAKMIAENASAQVLSGIIKQEIFDEPKYIKVEYEKINDLIGTTLSKQEIDSILKWLGFEIEDDGAKAPSWRQDVSIWQDLAEEVARIYGFENIKATPMSKLKAPKKSEYYYKEFAKDLLVNTGFVEVFNYAFLSEIDAKEIDLKSTDLLEIINPVQKDIKYLRNSLVPGLLKAVAKNPTFDQILIFEIGNVFAKTSETTKLGIAASGKSAKERVEKAIAALKENFRFEENQLEIKELAREDLVRFKIKKPLTYVLEIDLTNIKKLAKFKEDQIKLSMPKKQIHYRPISKFPSITRDLAFLVDRKTSTDEIIDTIFGLSSNISRVELFDEYSSDKLGKNKKNIAFHIFLQDMNKTMTDNDANLIINNIIKIIENKFNAKLRS